MIAAMRPGGEASTRASSTASMVKVAGSMSISNGALISAWPAVAFIGAVEIAMQQVRRARVPRAAIMARPCQRCRAMWSRRSAPRTRRRSRRVRR